MEKVYIVTPWIEGSDGSRFLNRIGVFTSLEKAKDEQALYAYPEAMAISEVVVDQSIEDDDYDDYPSREERLLEEEE